MSDPISALPSWQADRLALLVDALGDPPTSSPERASLVWLAGFELPTVENLAAVIRRARAAELADYCTYYGLRLPGECGNDQPWREGKS
jgi:hypothetical protein